MEILQLLTNLLSGEELGKFQPFFELLKSSDFNLSKILQNLTPEHLQPVINAFASQTKSRTESVRQYSGLSPISKIADKEVVYSLNKYLSND